MIAPSLHPLIDPSCATPETRASDDDFDYENGPSDLCGQVIWKALHQMVDQVGRMEIRNKEENEAREARIIGTSSDGPMAFHKLDKDTWIHIVSFLVPSRPRALSGQTKQEHSYLKYHPTDGLRRLYQSLPDESEVGYIKRSDIRSDALAKLMRVSIEFKNIAGPFLYRYIICDSLPLLAQGTERMWGAVHIHCEPKFKLFRHCRTLQLEYSFKGNVASTSYFDIMQSGYGLFQMSGEMDQVLDAKQQGAAEAVGISTALKWLLSAFWTNDPEPRFPNLKTVTIGAIFGAHEPLWELITSPDSTLECRNMSTYEVCRKQPSITEVIEMCRIFTMNLLRLCPLVHYCQRSFSGPLAPPRGFDWAGTANATRKLPRGALFIKAASIPQFTFHMSINSYVVPAADGQPTKWILETSDRVHSINQLVWNVYKMVDEYHKLVVENGNRKPALDIEAYISSRRYIRLPAHLPSTWNDKTADVRTCATPKEEAELLEQYQAPIYDKMRTEKLRDCKGYITSWKTAHEAPDCVACGWTFEEPKPAANITVDAESDDEEYEEIMTPGTGVAWGVLPGAKATSKAGKGKGKGKGKKGKGRKGN